MKASAARRNVKTVKKAKIKAKSAADKTLTAKRRKENIHGQERGKLLLKTLYRFIKTASKNGKSKLTVRANDLKGCGLIYTWDLEKHCEDTAPNFFAGMKKVLLEDLNKNGYEVKCTVKRNSETVWHGQMSDLYPTFHYAGHSMTIDISWE